MIRALLLFSAIATLTLSGCGDDGAVVDDAGVDAGPTDTSPPSDGGGDADTGASDAAAADTGPDPRCPGPTCPTNIIALDGFQIGRPCALRLDGELFCVDEDPPGGSGPVFTSAGNFLGGEEIARGMSETCVLFESHIVSCFRPGMVPFEIPELFDALDIDTWDDHTCVVRPDRLTCWGDNSTGQIEPGGSARYPEMHDVPGVTAAVRVATSATATCAIVRGGGVACWGDDFGATPTPMAEISDAEEITAGEDHFCVTAADGTVQCFGDADAGEEVTVPAGIDDAEEAVAFHGETCVRHATGAVSCWGEAGVSGQTEASPLEAIAGLDDAVLLANHCALRATGTVSCWTERDSLFDATGL